MVLIPPPRPRPDDTTENTAHAVEIEFAAAGGRVDLVVSAVRDDNPGELQVIDHGHSVVIRAWHSILLTAATLHWHTGSRTGIPEVRSMVIPLDHPCHVDAHRIVWSCTVAPGAEDPEPWRRSGRADP